MAEEVIGFKVNVDTGSGALSVGALRQEFIEAREALNQTTKGTEAYEKALLRLANAKNGIFNLNKELRALNPEQMAHQFVNVGNAIVGGFAAAQGAAALFGGESENIAKAILKIQASMALLEGFKAIEQGVQSFNALALSIGRVQLALTGILGAAFIGGIAYLMDQFTKLQDTVIGTTKELSDHQIEVSKLELEYQKLTGSISDVEFAMKSLDIETQKALDSLKVETETKLKEVTGFWNQLWSFIKGGAVGLAKDNATAIGKVLEEQSKKEAEITEEAELKKKNIKQKNANETISDDLAKWTELNKIDQKALDDQLKQVEGYGNLELAKYKSVEQAKIDFKKRIEAEANRVAVENAAARIAIEGKVFATLTSLGSLANKNAEKNAIFQRKLAAVNIIVQQAEALAGAIKGASKLTFPANLVAIATSVASIVAIFAEIKTLFSKAGDIGGAPSLETGGVSAPSVSAAQSFTPNESTDLTQQGQSTSTTPQQQTVRAWVVESDITMTQDRVNKLQTWAKFG